MNVLVFDTYEEMAQAAAGEIEGLLAKRPNCVLGLATGSTPIGVYAHLVEACRAGRISFSDAVTFNLDEYRGLAADHPQSYRYFMNEHLFGHVDIPSDATHLPDGANEDAEAECARYEAEIERAGGLDFQLLGIGHNGHIGFNEPADNFPVRTHLVQLAQRTIQANSRLFDSVDEVPREAYTMGVGTILKARRVVLLASGASKAEIVRAALRGPVTPEVPGSALQLHRDVTVILDKEAARCL